MDPVDTTTSLIDGLVGLIILVGLTLGSLNWYAGLTERLNQKRALTCEEKTVTTIGACRQDGFCGVKFNDGSIGHMYLPVIDGPCK